jgi:hypothetical protein
MAEAGEQGAKVGSPSVEQSGWSLTDREFDMALKWLRHKDKEKKAQSIASLRGEKLEELTEQEFKSSLAWLEEKDPQAFAELQKLRAADPARFAGEVRSLIEREIRKTLADRKRGLIREMIFGVVGGLGLFLFGMVLMSEGLRKAAGPKLKSILESVTKKSLRGFFVGAGVTAVIQSSSATTVIIVGLVNAGLLTLKQAIGVIIGSNVGTTATAWLVSATGLEFLDISLYSMPAIGLGFLLYIGGRTRKWKSVGEIMLGFGIL